MKNIILIILCSLSLSLYAQEKSYPTPKKKNYMPIMTRGIGVSFQKFEALNARLVGLPQYESLRNHMFTLSAGTMHVKNNFVSGLTLTGGSSLSGDRDEKSSAMRFLSAGLDFGYDVIPSDKVMLYPLVGVGAETYHAIFYKDNSAVDFNTVLISPTVQNDIRSVKFVNTFITYRFGLGIALKSPKSSGMIGLQAGYTGSFKDNSWKSNEYQSLANAPSDNLSRFNVSLIFGGSGMMMR